MDMFQMAITARLADMGWSRMGKLLLYRLGPKSDRTGLHLITCDSELRDSFVEKTGVQEGRFAVHAKQIPGAADRSSEPTDDSKERGMERLAAAWRARACHLARRAALSSQGVTAKVCRPSR